QVTVLAADKENDPDVLSIIASSASLYISPIPSTKPIGAVRVGRVGGEFVVMPTQAELEESDLDLIVAGTRDAVAMIEGFARQLPDEVMADAIMFGHQHVVRIVELIEELRQRAGLGPKELPPPTPASPLAAELYQKYGKELRERKLTKGKHARAG